LVTVHQWVRDKDWHFAAWVTLMMNVNFWGIS